MQTEVYAKALAQQPTVCVTSFNQLRFQSNNPLWSTPYVTTN